MTSMGRLLVHGGTLVPMTQRGLTFTGDVLIEKGRIAAIGASIEPPEETERLDARGCLVMPGFVQAHVHVVQSLARHRAEGLPLLRWLTERIWPYEAALAPAETSAAARLGIAELLTSGTTTALDMGSTHHHDKVFGAADALGIRLVSGKCLMDEGAGGLVEDCETALAETERLGARWHGAAHGRLRYAVAPRFILSCSRRLLEGAAALARRNGWMLHTHAAENPEETRLVRERTGRGNVQALADLGIAGPDCVLAHCVHLDPDEVESLSSRSTGVAHCPGTNLKLASGIADLPGLLSAGIRVGLGADGPPCNNRLSVFHEMALAGTVHNLRSGPGAVDAWTVLELATWRGAEVIGLTSEVGRLAPGLRGDLVVLEPGWASEPAADAATMVVYGCGVECVRDVIVDGIPVVFDRRLTTDSAAAIRGEARAAASALGARLGWT